MADELNKVYCSHMFDCPIYQVSSKRRDIPNVIVKKDGKYCCMAAKGSSLANCERVVTLNLLEQITQGLIKIKWNL